MRSHKFLAVLTVVNFAILITLLVGAAPTNPTDKVAPSVVRAQAIELVDAEGNVRAQMHLAAKGGGSIRLRDAKGEVRFKLEAQADGGGLLFLDKNTEPAVQLGAGANGPTLTLTGLDKKQKVITP